jgi:hypothetical protein
MGNQFRKLAKTIVINLNEKRFQFSIYRKPTQTDIIIPNSSCHLYEHKISSINYLLNRLHTYSITGKANEVEKNTIKNILHNNEYDTKLINKPPPQKKQKTKQRYRLTKTKAK